METIGRAEILAAVGHHPYARFVAGASRDLVGLRVDGGVFWRCVGPFGPYGHVLGDAPSALSAARAAGLLHDLDRLNVPRAAGMPAGWVLREAWDYRWLMGELARPATPAKVTAVAGDDAVSSLLDVAYPHSELRPGHPLVQRWYGIELDGLLVACAADRTVPTPEPGAVPTGAIGGVAVHPDYRSRGLGAVVTAAVASLLRQRHELVGLGVTEGNEAASRVYERLGFTGVHRVRSVRPSTGRPGA